MDAIQSFFAKHHAVPADDHGPQWPRSADEALIAWFEQDCRLLRGRQLALREVPHVRARVAEIAAEMWDRITVLAQECAERPADWPGRSRVGKLLAVLATSGDLLRVTVR